MIKCQMNMLLADAIKGKLLSIGGKLYRDIDPGDDDNENIYTRGILFSPSLIKKKKGKPNQCHCNSCLYYLTDPDKYLICTGFGLYKEKWVSHSWLVDRNDHSIIYETTVKMEKYFGYIMNDQESDKFQYEITSI